MPPNAVKTIRDLIFYRYAKLIAESAGMGKDNYAFIMSRFKKLQTGEIQWSSSIREYIKEREKPNQCIYCGTNEKLTLEHIIPQARGGPDSPDNAIWICRSCNSSKGSKRLYEFYTLKNKDKIPRIAEGKYLKLIYKLHEERGTLNLLKTQIKQLCCQCDMDALCPELEKLTVYCLEGFLKKKS